MLIPFLTKVLKFKIKHSNTLFNEGIIYNYVMLLVDLVIIL